ncbi:MAG TPA: SHOCT domain-containing protein [Solirubrobacteraceae bacterium]|jgi:hypothetical protein|nr:SHOCT domain-containing protein [Solirubrobacteraceae bacterium]
MFGRKRKQQQDALGLPVDDGSGLSVPPPATTVTVNTSAGAMPPITPVAPAAPRAQTPTTQIPVNISGAAALAQIFSGRGPVGELIGQIKSDPEGFRKRMIAEAQAAGVSTFVMTPQGMAPIGHPPGAPAPAHVDVIDELTKAAHLHDTGALTDAEFAALKKKLLGE